MGQDMYLTGTLAKSYGSAVDLGTQAGLPIKAVVVELGAWCKHPNLHSYIMREFHDDERDPREPIWLDQSRIEKIMKAIRENQLPGTSDKLRGPWNDYYMLNHEQLEDLAIFQKALEWLSLATPYPSSAERPDDAVVFPSVAYQASW